MTTINMSANEENVFVGPANEIAVNTFDNRHGSPYDRGSADSWYRRGFYPHYYVEGTGSSPRIEESKMSKAEIRAYKAGFDDNEALGEHKEW
jgi:hypothetical protein